MKQKKVDLLDKPKRIIDAEQYIQIGTFNIEDTDKTVEKYKQMGKWEYVEVDYDGDLILNN